MEEFVKTACIGRDPTHGYEHMKKVAENAAKIYQGTERENKIVYAAAWLHDVADHKYDDGTLMQQVEEFVNTNYPEDAQLILEIIKNVSFSVEKKLRQQGDPLVIWRQTMGDMVHLRHVVSDADKLEALGKIGYQRCFGYAKHKLNCTDEQAKKHVTQHAQDKLLILVSQNYIRTDIGREMALKLEQEFIAELSN